MIRDARRFPNSRGGRPWGGSPHPRNSMMTRDRSPVQQIRRNRLEDEGGFQQQRHKIPSLLQSNSKQHNSPYFKPSPNNISGQQQFRPEILQQQQQQQPSRFSSQPIRSNFRRPVNFGNRNPSSFSESQFEAPPQSFNNERRGGRNPQNKPYNNNYRPQQQQFRRPNEMENQIKKDEVSGLGGGGYTNFHPWNTTTTTIPINVPPPSGQQQEQSNLEYYQSQTNLFPPPGTNSTEMTHNHNNFLTSNVVNPFFGSNSNTELNVAGFLPMPKYGPPLPPLPPSQPMSSLPPPPLPQLNSAVQPEASQFQSMNNFISMPSNNGGSSDINKSLNEASSGTTLYHGQKFNEPPPPPSNLTMSMRDDMGILQSQERSSLIPSAPMTVPSINNSSMGSANPVNMSGHDSSKVGDSTNFNPGFRQADTPSYIRTATTVPRFSKPPPPPPPSPPKIGSIANVFNSSSNNSKKKPSFEEQVAELISADNRVSHEARFLDLTTTLGITLNCSPSIKISDQGTRLYAFKVEFSRDNCWGVADGQYFSNIATARESAYEVACKEASEIFKRNLSDKNTLDNSVLNPGEENSSRSKVYRSQKQWPYSTKEAVEPASQGSNDGMSKSKAPPLMDVPKISPMSSGKSSLKRPTMEHRFKDYMDALQMQCWLKHLTNNDFGRSTVCIEIEIQSYDKRFHEFFHGDYCKDENAAKESAFESACKGLEKRFRDELSDIITQDTPKHQRAFMDLRSALGLEFTCVRETKTGVNGAEYNAFNIKFSRGGSEAETVYGEFNPDVKAAKESAYELATRQVRYSYGPELDVNAQERGNNSKNSKKPDEEQHSVEWQPPMKRLFNPLHSTSPFAYVPPLVKSTKQAQDQVENNSGNSVEYGRTHEYRFKEHISIFHVEYALKKIPKFEGGHKIFAYEVTVQGQGGKYNQKTMGEYFRDEDMAKESAFRYALEELTTRYRSEMTRLGGNPQSQNLRML